MISGVGEGGGREATVNRTDGLGHCCICVLRNEEEWRVRNGRDGKMAECKKRLNRKYSTWWLTRRRRRSNEEEQRVDESKESKTLLLLLLLV
jgi:hypothetical protein